MLCGSTDEIHMKNTSRRICFVTNMSSTRQKIIKAIPHNYRLRLFHSLACIFSVILHKFRLTGAGPPALNLYNLTAQLNENNYAV